MKAWSGYSACSRGGTGTFDSVPMTVSNCYIDPMMRTFGAHSTASPAVKSRFATSERTLQPGKAESREAEGELAAFDRLDVHPAIDGPFQMLPQDDDSIALVYPPRQGSTLADMIDAGEDIPANRIILDVASALEAAHSEGVTHGRLAPRWIEVLPDAVKVRGFSLARAEGIPAATQLLADDEAFLAPEMLQRNTGGAPADIFALGKLIQTLFPHDQVMQNLGRRLADPDINSRNLPAGYIREALAGAFGIGTITPEPRAGADRPDIEMTPATPVVEIDENGLLVTGTAIGSYIITDHLGSGGFSHVYLASHPMSGSPRTIKVFKVADAEDLVSHEFSVLEKIDDPNVVRVIDAGESVVGWYMVSEYLDGETLAQRVDAFDGTSRPEEASLIGYEILNALSAIHARQIYHRDIKPENVILVEDRGAVLFDFGVAATRRAQVDGLTPSYWPPGVEVGVSEPDPDLFGVGVILCELLTGEHPYPDKNPHGGRPPDTSQLPPGISRVLARAIDPDSAARFQSAEEFKAALEPYVDQDRTIDVSRHGVYRRVEQLIAAGKLDDAENLCLPQWKRLLGHINRARADLPGSFEVEAIVGLQVRLSEESRGLEQRTDNTGEAEADTWTYQVSGKPGLMIDVRIAAFDDGTAHIQTIDTYSSVAPFNQLKNRLRIGISGEGDSMRMRLRKVVERPGKLPSRNQTTVADLGSLTGFDVEDLLMNSGATAVGKRSDLGFLNPPRSRNELEVHLPVESRNDVVLVAYLLTTIVPWAREAGLLI